MAEFSPEHYGFTKDQWDKLPEASKRRLAGDDYPEFEAQATTIPQTIVKAAAKKKGLLSRLKRSKREE